MANPSLQIGNSNWAIKEDNLLGYSTAGTRFVPQPITMTRESAGTRVNPSGLVETVELLGSELVTNGDFAINGVINTVSFSIGFTSSDTEVSIANSILNLTNAAVGGFDGRVRFTNGVDASGFLTIGNQYLLEYTITENNDSSGLNLFDGNSYELIDSSVGTHKHYYEAEGSSVYLRNTTNNTNIKFSSLSLKESTKNNLARVDYDGTASSLLVEPQRTNLVLNSEPTTNEGAAANITYESFSWAIGFNNCVAFGDNSVLRYRYGSSVTSGTEYTLSAYILMDDNSEPIVSNNNSIGDFSLNIGNTAASGTNTSVSMGNNIWRVSKTQTATQTTSNNGVIKYTGQSSKGFKVVGLQMEVGSYSTSYIPTDGGTVTRVQDQYSKTGISNLINSEEGVLFAEIAALDNDGTFRMIAISDGTIDNVVNFYYRTDINKITIRLKSGSTQEIFESFDITATNFNKVAFRYKSGESNLFINGVKQKVSDYTATNMPIGLSQLSLDSGGNTSFFFGKVRQLQVFKTALTDSELIALTT